MKRVLIMGALAGMGRALAREQGRRGRAVYLTDNDPAELNRVAADLRVRYGVPVRCGQMEPAASGAHRQLVDDVRAALGGLDLAFYCHDYPGDQRLGEEEVTEAAAIVDTNLKAMISLCNPLADFFERQQRGCLVGLVSVAADRGRRDDYLYAAAKAGSAVYLEGLRNRLYNANVQVLTVKIGAVDAEGCADRYGTVPSVSPERAAGAICRAQAAGRDQVYVPWFWRYIMLGIRAIPGKLYKRLAWARPG